MGNKNKQKANKSVVEQAQAEVTEAANEAREGAKQVTTETMTAFDEVVQSLQSKEGKEPAAEASTEAAESDQAPAPSVGTENTENAPAVTPAPAATVEAHKPMPEGTTDDTRAPLQLPKSAIVKEKKPPFDWNGKVLKPIADGFSLVGKAISKAADVVGNFTLAFILMCFYLILNALPGALYVLGWCARACFNAAQKGWKQEPIVVLDLGELVKKYEPPHKLTVVNTVTQQAA